MGSAAILVGIAVWSVTLYAIRHWISAMPPRLWAVARDELTTGRNEHDAKAQKALQEAAARQVGAIVKGIRDYHDDVAAQFRRQVADAEVRVRVAERHAVDTAVALETANALVREMRAALEGIRGRNGGEAEDAPDTGASAKASNSADMKMPSPSSAPRPANGGDEQSSDDADELTKVIVVRPVDPLPVPLRRPPPVPHAPLAPAVEGGSQEGEQGPAVSPAPGGEESR